MPGKVYALETSESVTTATSGVNNTCWITVAVIIGILIFIFIINDLLMKKQEKKELRQQKNVKINEEDNEYNEYNEVPKKSRCSIHN